MSGPILFIIFVVVVDSLIKSSRNKQKNVATKNPRPGSFSDLRRILDEEIQKDRMRELERRKEIEDKKKQRQINFLKETKKIEDKPKSFELQPRDMEFEDLRQRNIDPIKEDKTMDTKDNLRQDIIRGIIFSEILSEPKSIKNQR